MSDFGACFGALTRAKRGERGLTQQALARAAFGDAARMSRISELETGKIRRPHQRTVAAIARALSLTAEEVTACRAQAVAAVRPSPAASASAPTPEAASDLLARVAALFVTEPPAQEASALYDFLQRRADEYRTLKAAARQDAEVEPELPFQFPPHAVDAEPEFDFNRRPEPQLTASDIPEALQPPQVDLLPAARAIAAVREARAVAALALGDAPGAMVHYEQAAIYLAPHAPEEAQSRHLAGLDLIREALNARAADDADAMPDALASQAGVLT